MLVKSLLIRMREGKELKAPRHASAAATRDDRLPYSQQIIIRIIIIEISILGIAAKA